MTRALGCVMFLLVALGATACGGAVDNTLTNAARDELGPLVAQVRSRAEGFDPSGAALALNDVRRAVADLRARGAMGGGRADAILASIDDVSRQLRYVPTTTTTTTTTAPPRPPAAPAPNRGHGNGNDQGSGKGKGGGKGED